MPSSCSGAAGETQGFFLEYERRAVRPGTMRERLAPYLRYYSTTQPLDDHGVTPAVLIVVEDTIIVPHFRRIAQLEMDRLGLSIPVVIQGDTRLYPHSAKHSEDIDVLRARQIF